MILNSKMDLIDQEEHDCSKLVRKCDSFNNFIAGKPSFTCHATRAKFQICRDSTCTTKNDIYLAYCKQCSTQAVRSWTEWRTQLRHYKSHNENCLGWMYRPFSSFLKSYFKIIKSSSYENHPLIFGTRRFSRYLSTTKLLMMEFKS